MILFMFQEQFVFSIKDKIRIRSNKEEIHIEISNFILSAKTLFPNMLTLICCNWMYLLAGYHSTQCKDQNKDKDDAVLVKLQSELI